MEQYYAQNTPKKRMPFLSFGFFIPLIGELLMAGAAFIPFAEASADGITVVATISKGMDLWFFIGVAALGLIFTLFRNGTGTLIFSLCGGFFTYLDVVGVYKHHMTMKLGAYLMIAAAALFILGGIILFVQKVKLKKNA